MPRPKIDKHWEERIFTLLENEKGIKDSAVAARLEDEGNKMGRDDYPASRTVNKYRQIWQSMDHEERLQYRYFHWPESMGTPDLPWEASTACLALLSIMDAAGMGRPTVRLARWYWRLTLAAPKIHRLRIRMALTLSSYESAELDPPTGVEWALAYHNFPGSDEDRKEAYEKAKTRKKGPVPELDLPIRAAGSDSSDAMAFFKGWAAALKEKKDDTNG